jgi:hypothetical protein
MYHVTVVNAGKENCAILGNFVELWKNSYKQK